MTTAEVGQRLRELPLVAEDMTEVAVRLGIIFVESDGLAVLSNGPLQVAFLNQSVPQVVVRFRVLWL